MTPNEIAQQLAELSRELSTATADIETIDRAHVTAKCAHEVAYARAFLKSEGSMEVRKQLAVIETEDSKFASEIAGQRLRSAQERLREIRSRLDVGRSLGAAVRSEWQASA